MIIEANKIWGRWQLKGNTLFILTPSGYQYSFPASDLKDQRLYKIILGQIGSKPWITVSDLIDFKSAAHEIQAR